MPDVETLDLWSVNCSTIKQSYKNMQIHVLRTQVKFSTKNLKAEMTVSAKCNNEIDYFLVGPDKQEDTERSA